jgi:uncharacterized membrane protein
MIDARAAPREYVRWMPLAVFVALLAMTVLLPDSVLRLFDYAGMAVCHRIPTRTFFVAGQQLPVCARDTGMFSTALLTALILLSRPRMRASNFPTRAISGVLAVLFLSWGFDGFNSYMLLLRGEVFLYAPQNWLRLVTGTGMGLAIGVFAAALFNQVAWRDATDAPIVSSWTALVAPVIGALAVIGLVLWRPAILHGPLATLSGIGIVALLTLVNSMMVLLVARRYSTFSLWRELAPYFAVGCALAIAELALIAMLRLTFLPDLPAL